MIVARERAARPGADEAEGAEGAARAAAADGAAEPQFDPSCPFCPGNETDTPPEVLRLPAGAERWRVRVVPNRYPALARLQDVPGGAPAFADSRTAVGPHEVVIESPDHSRRFHDLTPDELFDVLGAYRARFAAAAAAPGVRHVIIFRNQGPLASATLVHPHSQLVGLPVVPPRTADALSRSLAFRADEGRSLTAALADEERESGSRIVYESESFTAFVPWAPSFDFEMWIVPRRTPPRFDRATDELLRGLADAMRRCLRALAAGLGDPDYNLILQTPPLLAGADEALPWYVQIIPRTARTAGFEIGSGVRIVTVSPDAAAERLRGALIDVARS